MGSKNYKNLDIIEYLLKKSDVTNDGFSFDNKDTCNSSERILGDYNSKEGNDLKLCLALIEEEKDEGNKVYQAHSSVYKDEH